MNKRSHQCSGFTLFELVAVTAVLGLVLFFAVPRFQAFRFFSQSSDPVSAIILQINGLKKRAIADRTDYVLNIQASTGSIWITSPLMSEEDAESAKEHAIQIPEEIIIQDLTYPPSAPSQEDPYSLGFSRYGYSDQALIHIKKGGEDITLKLEPFLSTVERLDSYVAFENCN